MAKKFRVIPQSELSEADFDDYPVWSEHYDYDELEEIEAWGLNRQQVLTLFAEKSPENGHCVYTLLQTNPFPERTRIFIRASISCTDGTRFKGYIMNEDAYCLTIFHSGKEFVFSKHPLLARENQRSEHKLLEVAGMSSGIFPMRYETEFHDKTGRRIAGVFMHSQAETQPVTDSGAAS